MYVFISLTRIYKSRSAKFCGNSMIYLMIASLCLLDKGSTPLHPF